MNPNEFRKEYLKEGQLLGTGSFGTVYSAKYNGKEYAIKKIPKATIHNNKDESLKAYFLNSLKNEITFQKRMSQFENSVKFYLDYEDENFYILVFEKCDETLESLLGRKQKFTSQEILDIMKGLNKVFKYMINNGLLHRDIKPKNIMIKYIDKDKTKYIPKITDYGFSRELKNGLAGTFIGSGPYKAPEIKINENGEETKYGNKSDLFSIGVMMYELYFNKYPFGNSLYGIIYKDKKEKDCEDKNLDDLINRLLIIDPEKRISWEEYFNHQFFKENEKNEKNESLITRFDRMEIEDDNKTNEHEIINLYDYILEKTLYQNNEERKQLMNIDQERNGSNIKTPDECINSNDDSFFILGVLGKYLEKLNIKVFIEKGDWQRSQDEREYHKNIFQLICNGYILKEKYLLVFDLSQQRLFQLEINPIERGIFNEKVKNMILNAYNLKEEEIMVTNIERDPKKFTVVVVIKSNFNKKIEKNVLLDFREEIDEDLKSLSRIEIEKILPVIKLNTSMLDPKNNNKDNKWNGGYRGGEVYNPPFGWSNYGINITQCFNDRNNDWIGCKDRSRQWCVAYCCTKGINKSMNQIYSNEKDCRHFGKNVGVGVYCTSDPKKMEDDTEIIEVDRNSYKIGFMLRVKPDKFRAPEKNQNIWVVSGNDNEFRPYGILLKSI